VNKIKMEKKEWTGIMLFLFLISSVSAGIVSNDYSVGSYHTGLAGQEPTNSQYDSRFTLTYQQGSSRDAENADHISNIGWFSAPSYCGDGTCDDDEDCSSCRSDCACASGYTCVSGVCVAEEAPGNGGACYYDWVCSDWYPEPCPPNGIQNRVCVNRGTCSGTLGMPNQQRNCTPAIPPGPAEPLFDISAKIPLRYKWINPGDVIGVDIILFNLGNITTLDVFFKYWIVDENNKLITEIQETRAIGERDKFRIAMVIPPEIEIGSYKFYVQITYDLDKVAMAGDSFEVIRGEMGKYLWIILLGLIIFLVIGILILLIFKLKKFKKSKSF